MNKNELKAKVKEYGYDSLCLRYEKARKNKCNANIRSEENCIRKSYIWYHRSDKWYGSGDCFETESKPGV